MQPGTTPEEDQILADLGYDVIGADGESQVESMVSSIEFQRPDDVQSLGGTDTSTDVDANDADTDSSDEEEEVVLDDTGRTYTYAETARQVAEDNDIETPAVQSLENPTNLLHHSDSFPELAARTRVSNIKVHIAQDAADDQASSHQVPHNLDKKDPVSEPNKPSRLVRPWYHTYLNDHGRPVLQKLGLLILGLVLTWGSLLLARPQQAIPQALSTVPVASVSTSGISVPTVYQSSISSTSKVHKPVSTPKTPSHSTGLMPVVLDILHGPQTSSLPGQAICSAEVYGRNEILVKIPQAVKASWLAKEAIKIAVSRDDKDIPTVVKTIASGFLIEVPTREAHGAFEVSIVTERKPKIHEVFRVDLGQHTITDALVVSKQLAKDLALYVAHAVNETTMWVHEVSAPAVDEGVSITQNMVQRLASLCDQALKEATGYFSALISKEELILRSRQAQVELQHATWDLREDLSLKLLTAQLSSKLWWLKVKGRQEDYQHYLAKAETFYKSKMAEATRAKAVRGEKMEREMRERRSEAPRTHDSIWRWRRVMG